MPAPRSKGKVVCGASMASKKCHTPGCDQILLWDNYADAEETRCPACLVPINFWCERLVYPDGPFEGRCGIHRGHARHDDIPDDIHAANEAGLRGPARVVYRQALDMDSAELARSNSAYLAAAAVEQANRGASLSEVVSTRKALTVSIKEEAAAKSNSGSAEEVGGDMVVNFYVEKDGTGGN